MNMSYNIEKKFTSKKGQDCIIQQWYEGADKYSCFVTVVYEVGGEVYTRGGFDRQM